VGEGGNPVKRNRFSQTVATVGYLLILPVCITLLMLLNGAQGQENIKGYLGEKVIQGTEFGKAPEGVGKDSCWKGSGTNNPGEAGCHEEVLKDGSRGRVFGESCEGNNILIDHTPGHPWKSGQRKCPPGQHVHEGDVGKPSKFDCNVFCGGNPNLKKGVCQTVGTGAPGVPPAPQPCQQLGKTSARCVCN